MGIRVADVDVVIITKSIAMTKSANSITMATDGATSIDTIDHAVIR